MAATLLTPSAVSRMAWIRIGATSGPGSCAAAGGLMESPHRPLTLAASPRRACLPTVATTRVGGGHPDYVVLADAGGDASAPRGRYQQDLWHYTIAKMSMRAPRPASRRFTGRFATSPIRPPARHNSSIHS